MKRIICAIIIGLMFISLTGCGDDDHSPSPTYVTAIISDSAYDGDIKLTPPSSFTVTQGMSPTVQSVYAGIDPVALSEFRAFLDFHLRGTGGVPGNAIIVSAFLDIFINSIQPSNGMIPIRIELVSFQPPTLLAADFDRSLLLPLTFTTIVPPISQADVGRHVFVDVTPLMIEAQWLGLSDFQIRILEDLGTVSPGLIEINDTTGDRGALAPLLQVEYY